MHNVSILAATLLSTNRLQNIDSVSQSVSVGKENISIAALNGWTWQIQSTQQDMEEENDWNATLLLI